MVEKNEKTYEVVEYTLGVKEGQERIIFANEEDMLEAEKRISDTKDIRIQLKEGDRTLGFIVKNSTIYEKWYKGEIQFGYLIPSKEEKK